MDRAQLVGGNKKGNDRWYETTIPIAEKLYTNHLKELIEQGLIDDKEIS